MIFRLSESINYKQKLSDVNVKLRYNCEISSLNGTKTRQRRIFANTKLVLKKRKQFFNDHFLITFPDESHSIEEERFISIGYSIINRILLVVHTEYSEDAEANIIRIISCRKATVLEREVYEQQE